MKGSVHMSILNDVAKNVKTDVGGDFLHEDENFGTEFPGIFEVLARNRFEGEDRKVGRLILYFEKGHAALCLSDKHTGQVAFIVSECIQSCLELLERKLQDGSVDWRKSKRWQG